MSLNKGILLSHGLEEGYYTVEESNWCLGGNNIKDYDRHKRELERIASSDISRYDSSNVSRVNIFTYKMPGMIKRLIRR